MCSIVGSFSENKFCELMKLNAYRGEFSHSISYITKEFESHTEKQFGQFKQIEFRTGLVEQTKDYYYLGHSQAPTGGLVLDANRIHPASNGKFKLLHNGIIKSSYVETLRSVLRSSNSWDTQLLLDYLVENNMNFEKLSDIDGAFACALIKESQFLTIFRNAPSVLFIDENFNISSTKFEGAKLVDVDSVFSLDLYNKKMKKISSFTSKSDPYYYG